MVQEHGGSNHLQQQHQHQLAKYGGGVAGTGVARASRKNKPKKVPQRGLGVAQLEKLRIEEQKKMEGGAALSSHGALGGGDGVLGHLPPPPPPSLALSALQSRSAADGGFPAALWSPVDPIKHPYKRSLCPQPPSPMVSTGLSLTASARHPTEPPSNQMYSSSGSRSSAAAAEEERETGGVDRSWPFMFKGMAAFRTTTSRAPPLVAPFSARTTTTGELAGLADVGPDLSRYEFRATNYFSKENGRARDPAFLTLSSQPPHLLKQPHVVPSYNDFSAMAFQGSNISSSSSQPFYSFLPVGPVRCERTLSECKTDVSEGVDLELKLGNC
ncbi:protein SPEAR2 isoform X3 [Oryza sativa Japonica Group]|uniref:protein SPEAR2 isoform X3 n=1 Tax=Oryza sativa subsp. japonica TaxID=39947 RepID=UPI00339BE0D3